MELWSQLPADPAYQISNLGRIRGKQGKIIGGTTDSHGYVQLQIHRPGDKPIQRAVHTLVAEVFISNPESKKVVNHINGIKTDNRAENLEWVTHQENCKKRVFANYGHRSRAVVQLSKSREIIKYWDSATSAAAALSIKASNITKCCRGESASSAGFVWVFKDNHDMPEDEIWETYCDSKGVERTVSSIGRVKLRSGVLSYGTKRYGYHIASGKYVHRLVAEAFCEKPAGKEYVNHKDGNPGNNRADNLEWVTNRENLIHASKMGLLTNRPTRIAVALYWGDCILGSTSRKWKRSA